ncbi:hypothetical protein AYI70_g5308 [Smittium culicis]|uniref:Uncharacterized protein n=1 Tax=Smittium culicis TaxID=133412 RepID=A0A1R1XV71_9FUNG|nr:hypothetical protein AYI70_g5308 [Smittium culicis]
MIITKLSACCFVAPTSIDASGIKKVGIANPSVPTNPAVAINIKTGVFNTLLSKNLPSLVTLIRGLRKNADTPTNSPYTTAIILNVGLYPCLLIRTFVISESKIPPTPDPLPTIPIAKPRLLSNHVPVAAIAHEKTSPDPIPNIAP